MDSRDIKSSPPPSLSDPSPLTPFQQSFPYLAPTSLSSLPSNPVTPSTKLLPSAPHLATQSQSTHTLPSPQTQPLFPSHRKPHLADSMHPTSNMPIPHNNPLSNDSHPSRPQSLKPPQVHALPSSSQSLPKLDPYSTPLPLAPINAPDPMRPAHLPRPAPLSAPSAQGFDFPSNRHHIVQEQQIRSQQLSSYNSSPSHNQLPHLQTRSAGASPVPTEALPQIASTRSSQHISSSMEAQNMPNANPSLHSISRQLSDSHMQPDSKIEPTQPLSLALPQQKKPALGSPKQATRQHTRPRPPFGQMQHLVDRQRSLQPRQQPPPLPPRPVMLARSRGSAVMQDVPRYQRHVTPSLPRHPALTSQVREAAPPGGNQQLEPDAMQHENMKLQDSNMDHQRHSMYRHELMSNTRQMTPVPAMAQQMPASPTVALSSGQRTSQAPSETARQREHHHQAVLPDEHGNQSAYPRDPGKRERSFSGTPISNLRVSDQRVSGQSPVRLHLHGSSHVGPHGNSDIQRSNTMRTGVEGSMSSRYRGETEQRDFDAASMTTTMKDGHGRSARREHGAPEELLSRPSESSVRAPKRSGLQNREVDSSGDAQTPLQGHAREMSRTQPLPPQMEAPKHSGAFEETDKIANSSRDAGIVRPNTMTERQANVREADHPARGDSPDRKGNDPSIDHQIPHVISQQSKQFPRDSQGRTVEQPVPRIVDEVMKTSPNADEHGYQTNAKKWQQTKNEEGKPFRSFPSSLATGKSKEAAQSTWTGQDRGSAKPKHSPAKEESQPRQYQQASPHFQAAIEPATVADPSASTVPRGVRTTNAGSRISIEGHESSNFEQAQVAEDNQGRSKVEEEETVVIGGTGTIANQEGHHGPSAVVGVSEFKKRSGAKERLTSQAEEPNRSSPADDNDSSQRKQLKVEDALAYLEKVKSQFSDQLNVYNQFLDIMKEFKANSIDTNEVIRRVSNLFRGHMDLILGFNTFLPPGYKIQVIENAKTGILNTGFHGPAGVFNILPAHRKVTSRTPGSRPGSKKRAGSFSSPKGTDSNILLHTSDANIGPSGSAMESEQLSRAASMIPTTVGPGRTATSSGIKSGASRRQHGFDVGNAASSRALHQSMPKADGGDAAHEFERAIGFVTIIKERFADSPETFKEFLDALVRFREEQKSIREVFEAVADLFGPHKDLLSQFKEFIPTIPSITNGIQDAKTMKERAPSHLPRRTTGSKVISESTPTRRTGVLNGKTKPRHRVREMQFFEDLKARLGPNKVHLYTEFIKCLSLFSQGIVSREELLYLTEDILHDDQDAHVSFLRYLDSMANVAEGGLDGEHQFSSSISSEAEPTAVDAARMAYYTSKPMSEIAAEAGLEQMHSYRRMPQDFPPCEYSGRSAQEKRILNDSWINVTTGSEDYSFKFMRRNQNEDNLFRCEDDRYELDLVIETNASTILKLETIVETISKLPLVEKKRHALGSGALSPIHFNAIQRIYGESGAEVISQLKMNPAVAGAVILKRLKEKDVTWRRARMEMNKVWREVGERNFHRSLDHRSAHFKAVDKKDLSTKSLLMDIMDPAASVMSRDAEMTRARGYPVEYGGGGANHRSQALKAVLAAAQCTSAKFSRRLQLEFEDVQVHSAVYRLLVNVVDDEATKKSIVKFGEMIQSFFGVVFEDDQNRRTETTRLGKGDVNVFYGDDSSYIVFRLYHLLYERVALAFQLGREQLADHERRTRLNEEGKRRLAKKRGRENIETQPWQLTKVVGSTEIDGKFSLGPTTEDFEGICEQFLDMAGQLTRSKMDCARYEDKCRALLGVDSYALFTIDKTVQKLIKGVETMFTGYSPTGGLCRLFYESQQRLHDAKKNGGRLDTEGIEVLYSMAASKRVAETRGQNANLIRLQSSGENGKCTILIHVVGQTGDEDLTRAAQAERAILDKFIEFCKPQSNSTTGGDTSDVEEPAPNDALGTGPGNIANTGHMVLGKRARGSRIQRSKRGRVGLDFLRFRLDDENKVGENLRSGAMIIRNGLEWRLDSSGIMRFAAGTGDFLLNKRRNVPWNKRLNDETVGSPRLQIKRMRRTLPTEEDKRSGGSREGMEGDAETSKEEATKMASKSEYGKTSTTEAGIEFDQTGIFAGATRNESPVNADIEMEGSKDSKASKVQDVETG